MHFFSQPFEEHIFWNGDIMGGNYSQHTPVRYSSPTRPGLRWSFFGPLQDKTQALPFQVIWKDQKVYFQDFLNISWVAYTQMDVGQSFVRHTAYFDPADIQTAVMRGKKLAPEHGSKKKQYFRAFGADSSLKNLKMNYLQSPEQKFTWDDLVFDKSRFPYLEQFMPRLSAHPEMNNLVINTTFSQILLVFSLNYI